MPESALPARSLVLTHLRTAAGWTRARLAQALGHRNETLLSAYERGAKPLSREMLLSLVEPMGYPPEAVDLLLMTHELIFPEPARASVLLADWEREIIDRAALTAASVAAKAAAETCRTGLTKPREAEAVAATRQLADELWPRLQKASRQERKNLVACFPEFWNWALAERVCQESERTASNSAEEALELAALGLEIAQRLPEDQVWRARVMGYCWAFVANARRVANDLAGADEACLRAREFWRMGCSSRLQLVAEWRLLDLEASLRRAQRRLPEALDLLEQALAVCGNDPLAKARILLKKEFVFEQTGEIGRALETLREAAPFVEAAGDPRLLFALRFNMADNLCHLGRYHEAEALLPHVRELAIKQANELSLIRVSWLSARIVAGLGRIEEALSGMETAREAFTQRRLPYDAALVSLDLAVLWLKAGQTARVKELMAAMRWVFHEKGIEREALAAFKLFADAVQQESVTIDLAYQVIVEISRVRRSAPPLPKGRGRS